MPSLTDYLAALQQPYRYFDPPELQEATVRKNPLGLPYNLSGNFAVVFHVNTDRGPRAVRCFFRDAPDLQYRYQQIDSYLRSRRESYESLVDFEYINKGIMVRGHWFPIVVMEWVEGKPLDTAIEERLNSPEQLRALAENWLRLDRELTELGVAHGDLQHGNVLVDRGELRLVDYDGMFVPAFRGKAAPESGHRNFQPPYRASGAFDETIDRFSSLVIYIALRALQIRPDLWQRHRMPDDAILFRQSDFENPGQSALISDLRALPDPELQTLVNALEGATTGHRSLPNLDGIVRGHQYSVPINTVGGSKADWWKARLPKVPAERGYKPAATSPRSSGKTADSWLSNLARNTEARDAARQFSGPKRPSSMVGSGERTWRLGDRVVHRTFGAGTVIDSRELPQGLEVTVRFDQGGTKQLLVSLAGLAPL